MIRIRPIILFVFLLVLCSSCVNNKTKSQETTTIEFDSAKNQSVQDTKFNLDILDEDRKDWTPLISAHRGGPYPGFPENAIETFDNMASKMNVIIECDIRMTQDSVLVMMHDETLDRTSTGRGKISDKTFFEISQLFLVDNDNNKTSYKIPKLEDVLIWGKNRVIFTLDAKSNIPYDRLIDMIRKTETENSVAVITYSTGQAKKLYKMAPELFLSVSTPSIEALDQLLNSNIPTKQMIAFVGTNEPSKEIYQRLSELNIPTILGTLGKLDEQAYASNDELYCEFVRNGANILSTDRPVEAHDQLAKCSSSLKD